MQGKDLSWYLLCIPEKNKVNEKPRVRTQKKNKILM